MLFRGTLEQKFGEGESQDQVEADLSHSRSSEVWVALFPDAVVMMVEHRGGAELRFAHLIDANLQIRGESPEGEKEYVNGRRVILGYKDRDERLKEYILTSKYAAALIVFEKKVAKLRESALKEEDDVRAIVDSAGAGPALEAFPE
jgi:hypothetical protein